VPVITSIAQLLTLIFIFHFWFRKTNKQLNRRMVIALLVLCITFFSYLYLSTFYIVDDPDTKQRFVWGQSEIENSYMQVKLVAVWLIMFVNLTVFIGLFVIIQRREKMNGSGDSAASPDTSPISAAPAGNDSNNSDTQQIVGRERRERVSQVDSSGDA
jgi:hypothetical protein